MRSNSRFFILSVIIAIFGLTNISWADEVVEQTLNFFPGVGVTLGTDKKSNKIVTQFVGARVSPLEYSLNGKNKLAIASPGVSFQTNSVVSFSISPVMIVIPNKIALGVDYFFPTKTIDKESFGVFIGFELL